MAADSFFQNSAYFKSDFGQTKIGLQFEGKQGRTGSSRCSWILMEDNSQRSFCLHCWSDNLNIFDSFTIFLGHFFRHFSTSTEIQGNSKTEKSTALDECDALKSAEYRRDAHYFTVKETNLDFLLHDHDDTHQGKGEEEYAIGDDVASYSILEKDVQEMMTVAAGKYD